MVPTPEICLSARSKPESTVISKWIDVATVRKGKLLTKMWFAMPAGIADAQCSELTSLNVLVIFTQICKACTCIVVKSRSRWLEGMYDFAEVLG